MGTNPDEEIRNAPDFVSGAFFSLSKNYDIGADDRGAGEHEGAKGPPLVKLMSRKWLISAIFSILRNSKCDGSDCQKSPRDFFDNLRNAPDFVSGAFFSIFGIFQFPADLPAGGIFALIHQEFQPPVQ